MEGPGGLRRIAVQVDGTGRTAWLDGKVQDRLEGYFEGLAAVCFAPDDLLLVKGSPEGRRRFLDRAAFNRWPAVLSEARDYLRALRSRNAALRTAGPDVEESFRDPLVRAGARLLVRRRDVVAELAPRVDLAFHQISGPGAPRAQIAYRPAGGLDLEGTEQGIAARYFPALAARSDRDRDRGFTSVGPHMDDLSLALAGAPCADLRQPGAAARARHRPEDLRDREHPRSCSGGRRCCCWTTCRQSWIPRRTAFFSATCARWTGRRSSPRPTRDSSRRRQGATPSSCGSSRAPWLA